MRWRGCLPIAVLAAFLVVGCKSTTAEESNAGAAATHKATRAATVTKYTRAEATDAQKDQWGKDNCPFGLPKSNPQWPHGPPSVETLLNSQDNAVGANVEKLRLNGRICHRDERCERCEEWDR